MANSDQTANSSFQDQRARIDRARSASSTGWSLLLGRDIASGVWKPNETLPTEPEIAHRFGAGRNAVREAVKILAAKGFVANRTQGRHHRPSGILLEPPRSEVLKLDVIGTGEQRQPIWTSYPNCARSSSRPSQRSQATHASAMETLRIFEAYDQMEKLSAEMQKLHRRGRCIPRTAFRSHSQPASGRSCSGVFAFVANEF